MYHRPRSRLVRIDLEGCVKYVDVWLSGVRPKAGVSGNVGDGDVRIDSGEGILVASEVLVASGEVGSMLEVLVAIVRGLEVIVSSGLEVLVASEEVVLVRVLEVLVISFLEELVANRRDVLLIRHSGNGGSMGAGFDWIKEMHRDAQEETAELEVEGQ